MYLKKSGFICLNVYINLPYIKFHIGGNIRR